LRLEIALAWVDDAALVERTLDLGLAGEINLGHFYAVILAASQNPVGRDTTWAWLQRHLPEVQERLHGTAMLADLLVGAIPYLGLGRADAVRAYFREHPVPGDDQGLANGLATLDAVERLIGRLSRGA